MGGRTSGSVPLPDRHADRADDRQSGAAGAGRAPRLRLHDLRHAFATFRFHQGADVRLIMETLGHSQISVTADLYTHVLMPRQRAASEAVDTLILGPEDSDDAPAESR